MWTGEKQSLFDRLREQQLNGLLSEGEQQQLAELFAELELEQESASRLAIEASRQREQLLEAEIAQGQERITALEELAERQRKIHAHAQAVLLELRRQQTEIQTEYQRRFAPSQHAA